MFERHDPFRFAYFVYAEDLPKTDPGFDENDTFCRQIRRNAIEIIFTYNPETGLLEMVAPGAAKQKDAIAAEFCKCILGLAELPPSTPKEAFKLNLLKNRDFQFTTDPCDNVQRTEVRMLQFDLPGAGSNQLIVNFRPRKNQSPGLIHEVIDSISDVRGLMRKQG